jgi:uncharacterized OB-fold protein
MAQTAEHTEAHVLLAGESVRNESDGSVRLVGGRCADCGTLFFPSAHVCPECMSEAVMAADLASDGTLYSWSVVHVAPRGWNTPYIAGYVDLSDGIRVFAHIAGTDASSLEMDMPVSLTTAILGEDDGVPVESYAFTPAKG